MGLFGKDRNAASAQRTPALEWILGAAGTVLLLACIGYLLYRGGQEDEKAGDVSVQVANISQVGSSYLVRFTARNEGTQTLASLNVSARLLDGDTEVSTAQAVIDYLPGRSMRSGGFYFTEDPRRHRLELRAEGYQSP